MFVALLSLLTFAQEAVCEDLIYVNNEKFASDQRFMVEIKSLFLMVRIMAYCTFVCITGNSIVVQSDEKLLHFYQFKLLYSVLYFAQGTH